MCSRIKSKLFSTCNITKVLLCPFLLNFVARTYSKVEILPEPGLNVVIGPNGTGKSTIVCGICLGLAGSPKILGRQNTIPEFIKHGESSAVIEIDL
jgi:chromosome segregation ATPase